MSDFGLSRFILLTRRSIDVRRNQLLEMSTVFEEKVKEGDSFVQEVCTLSLSLSCVTFRREPKTIIRKNMKTCRIYFFIILFRFCRMSFKNFNKTPFAELHAVISPFFFLVFRYILFSFFLIGCFIWIKFIVLLEHFACSLTYSTIVLTEICHLQFSLLETKL